MINLLTNWKLYCILVLMIALGVQTLRLNNAQHERDLTSEKIITLQTAINSAQASYKKQSETLRLREQEAAKRAKQSQLHMDEMMKEVIPGGCQGAIDWMIAHR